jgi:hypothetical protein
MAKVPNSDDIQQILKAALLMPATLFTENPAQQRTDCPHIQK